MRESGARAAKRVRFSEQPQICEFESHSSVLKTPRAFERRVQGGSRNPPKPNIFAAPPLWTLWQAQPSLPPEGEDGGDDARLGRPPNAGDRGELASTVCPRGAAPGPSSLKREREESCFEREPGACVEEPAAENAWDDRVTVDGGTKVLYRFGEEGRGLSQRLPPLPDSRLLLAFLESSSDPDDGVLSALRRPCGVWEGDQGSDCGSRWSGASAGSRLHQPSCGLSSCECWRERLAGLARATPPPLPSALSASPRKSACLKTLVRWRSEDAGSPLDSPTIRSPAPLALRTLSCAEAEPVESLRLDSLQLDSLLLWDPPSDSGLCAEHGPTCAEGCSTECSHEMLGGLARSLSGGECWPALDLHSYSPTAARACKAQALAVRPLVLLAQHHSSPSRLAENAVLDPLRSSANAASALAPSPAPASPPSPPRAVKPYPGLRLEVES